MSVTLTPKETIATFSVSSEGTGVAQTVHVGGSTHTFNVDAAPAFGGKDSAPSPIAYALAAFVSCSQVTAQIVAKTQKISVDHFEFDLRADLDTAILVGGAAEGNANFESLTVRAVLTTNATDEDVQRLRIETERRCPIYQLFAKSGVAVNTVWTTVPAR